MIRAEAPAARRQAREARRVARASGRAARRAREAERPPAPPHATVLRPLGGGEANLIVDVAEADFLPALMADLMADDWRARIEARRATRRGRRDGLMELSQPLHRRFHLVLLEAVCREPGFPRVDPAKLVGLGLVIRRESRDGPRAWMRENGMGRGWLAVGAAAELDPDPASEAAVQPEGAPRAARALERLLAERRGTARRLSEDVAPLFVAPPEVCAARRRTILYGLVPVTSAETTAAPPPLEDLPAAEDRGLTNHFSVYLKKRSARSLPRAGQALDPEWAPLELSAATGDDRKLYRLAVLLRQLGSELGAFGPGEDAARLRAKLDELRLPVRIDRFGHVLASMGAADWCAQAAGILVGAEPNASGLTMPYRWPEVSQEMEDELLALARACLTARFAEIAPERPKFDDDDAQYRVRAFCRLSGHDHCPPRLIWSPVSEPFRIRPWWDSDAPPTRVSLPDIAQARQVKPGVAFAMPPALANLLQSDMKKLKDGEKSGGGSMEIGWLCCFSIPIITICAFIVLNIFLSLFNIIFQWLLWIRICLPFPKPRSDG
ncbi:hypothetical protein P2H44_22940 [Albimonas sp. CAU 1670]|uniref:hypothetical protein n=1 Tax=Albimonas sp. CAU 1670 TaxID=3032599 RepID=UPI0023DB60A4|nr:hypothetical protein [Albimonas sp. CAU 1670]MDF2235422.1 hypothetical protein [Albimonas sp. CAU 1670]